MEHHHHHHDHHYDDGGNACMRIIAIILMYLPLTPLWVIVFSVVTLFICGCAMDDSFVRKNSLHALMMGVLWVPVILINVIPVIGWIVNLLYFLCFWVFMVLNLFGAPTGEFTGLPILSSIVQGY